MNAGLIGCGNISDAYLRNKEIFRQFRVVGCADLNSAAAASKGEKYGIVPMTVGELLESPQIDTVLNLTTPQAHAEIDLAALEHGKHVYSEKPFALSVADGRRVLELARQRGLCVGGAPDTFLGGAHQLCRKLVDSGAVGKVVAGTAFMLCHGHESWHPAPGFYYLSGGGPLFDMGPYYLTALVDLLGPVKQVSAMNTRSTDLRKGCGANENKTFPVEVDTHNAALLEFHSGAVITLITSFDVWKHSGYCDIELYGTDGSLHIPDPNCFDGAVKLFRGGDGGDWQTPAGNFGYTENRRGVGLADMAAGIEKGRDFRCSGLLACHVLEVMESIIRAGAEKRMVQIASSCERPAPLPEGLADGELD